MPLGPKDAAASPEAERENSSGISWNRSSPICYASGNDIDNDVELTPDFLPTFFNRLQPSSDGRAPLGLAWSS